MSKTFPRVFPTKKGEKARGQRWPVGARPAAGLGLSGGGKGRSRNDRLPLFLNGEAAGSEGWDETQR
jgi:hypothetical protein